MSDQNDIEIEGFDDDIESAYRRALAAMDAAEEEVGRALTELTDDAEQPPAQEPTSDEPGGLLAAGPADHPDGEVADAPSDDGEPVTPRQVIEAVLFVGGEAITAKRLCTVLRGEFQPEQVGALIDELNNTYTAQNRPYEIHLVEGGYQLRLRPEYDTIRRRVYGMGTREVRLSQDALEILALVAYEQPISRGQIEEFGKKNAAGLLRQLVRRELLEVDRSNGGGTKLQYRTTARFLSVFGIGHPDELPQMEALQYK